MEGTSGAAFCMPAGCRSSGMAGGSPSGMFWTGRRSPDMPLVMSAGVWVRVTQAWTPRLVCPGICRGSRGRLRKGCTAEGRPYQAGVLLLQPDCRIGVVCAVRIGTTIMCQAGDVSRHPVAAAIQIGCGTGGLPRMVIDSLRRIWAMGEYSLRAAV